MSVTITEEPCASQIAELWPLLVEHREELTTNKALMKLAPDVERYHQAEAAGIMFGLIAREHGRIIGYSINFFARNLHYDMMYVHNDVLYVAKEHRGNVGLRLIRETERVAKAKGAQLMLWHAKPNTSLDQLMPRIGYRVQDIMYSREL